MEKTFLRKLFNDLGSLTGKNSRDVSTTAQQGNNDTKSTPAEKSDEVRSRLLADINHEFRTPMIAILGFAEILKAELTIPEHREMAEQISFAGKRLMSTMESILELVLFAVPDDKTSNKTIDAEKRKGSYCPKILLIEDNLLIIKILTMHLENLFEIHNAVDKKAALELAGKNKFDAVMLDIYLGLDGNGKELVKELKKLDEYSNIPFIAISGYDLLEDKEKFLEEGFDYYLPKPFYKHELISILSDALKARSMQ